MLDLGEVRRRAAARADVASPANPANRLIPTTQISQLATLATLASANDATPAHDWATDERQVLSYLDWLGPMEPAALSVAARLPLGATIGALRSLQRRRHVARKAGGWCITQAAIRAIGAGTP